MTLTISAPGPANPTDRGCPGRALRSLLLLAAVSALGLPTRLGGDESKWIAVGDLHSWFSSAGGEREVGRTGQVSDQQDGLRWPAQFADQDVQAAKALWIGTTNYADPLNGTNYDFKVVHVGPRVLDDLSTMMPMEFKLVARFDHPSVFVDGVPGSDLMFGLDEVDEIDPDLPADRMLYNVVHSAVGITLTRRIYAFTNQYHDNYFIYDYVFKNTGIVTRDSSITHSQTLTDVVFFFQYRYAPSREASVYGRTPSATPQSVSWGHSTINDAVFTHPTTGEPFRAQFAWLGIHSQAANDIIGGPDVIRDGHLMAPHYVGVITLHADASPSDSSDDTAQPFTTMYLQSDLPITSANNQFNSVQMAVEYAAMTAGHPAKRHGEDVGCPTPIDCGGTANTYVKAGDSGNPGGYTHGQGFGPYDMAPGESIHIVLAEGVSGIDRDLSYDIGAQWLAGGASLPLPSKVGGGTTNNADFFKNAWVYTGEDSLFQTLQRAKDSWEGGSTMDPLVIPRPPDPPDLFEVNSGGDRIIVSWDYSGGLPPDVRGFKVYRAADIPDTTFTEVFSTSDPSVSSYEDKQAVRGFDYYYYLEAFDGVSLVSSKFWTKTTEPASLRRPPGYKVVNTFRYDLADIRIVPNPYNISAQAIQFGQSDRDRIMFYNLPPTCRIKIYTERGDLIQSIEHTDGSGDERWNSVTSSRQIVVSGIYIVYFEVADDYNDPITGELVYRKGASEIKKLIVVR